MRYLGEFGARDVDRETALKRGDQVVVRSHRGTEFGEVLSDATERTKELLGRSDTTGRILRVVSAEDERQRDESWRLAESYFRDAKETITEQGLPMQLVDVETLLGGEKAVFYYTSDDRVDFRELVKALAKQFKTRIEMRQIGIRDEAKLLADYGDCGKPVCCNTHLDKMPRVSMKMAKVQKASLDPNKISGRCGRLKCCLRYEYDTYVEHQKELPKQGKWIETDNGIGKVLSQEILAKKLLVAFEDGRRVIVSASEVKGVVPPPDRSRQDSGTPSQKNRDRSRTGRPGHKPEQPTQPAIEGQDQKPKRTRRSNERRKPASAQVKPAEPGPDQRAENVLPNDSGEPKKKRRRRRTRRKPNPNKRDGDASDGGSQ